MKLKFTYFVSLFLIYGICWAQQHQWQEANDNFDQKKYQETITICDNIALSESSEDLKNAALLLKGESLLKLKKYDASIKSIGQYLENTFEEENDFTIYANTIMGDLHTKKKNYTKATSHYLKAYNTTASSKKASRSNLSEDIANCYNSNKNYIKAIKWYKLSIEFGTENSSKELTNKWINLGKVQSNFGDYDAAKTSFLSAKNEAITGPSNQLEEIEMLISKLNNNIETEEHVKTDYLELKEKENLEKIETANLKQVKSIEEIEKLSEAMQLIEYKIKAQADEFEKKLLSEKLEKIRKEQELKLAEVEIETERNKVIQKESKLNEEKALSKAKSAQIWTLIIGISLLLFGIFALLYFYFMKVKNGKILTQKNQEITSQKSILENKNALISESLNYAEKLQKAILPSESSIKSLFPRSFILLNPKDKVSGDFYWSHSTEKWQYIAAIDCTGHGVPGAFMSIICNDILNEIIKESNEPELAEILNESIVKISDRFSSKNANKIHLDGMDLSIIRYDKKNKTLEHSGAKNPAYLCIDEEILILKGSPWSISHKEESKRQTIKFQTNVVELNSQATLYLFSDGYADQKGGEKNKKYYYPPFRKLLSQASQLPPEKQHSILTKEFEQWKNQKEQIDDVLIIGITLD